MKIKFLRTSRGISIDSSHPNQIQDLFGALWKKWEKKELPHFIILRAPQLNAKATQWDFWPYPLLEKILRQENAHKDPWAYIKQGHPDLFILQLPEGEDHYTLADLKEKGLFSFFDYAPMELSWRFVVIHQAHQLGEIIFNKLLKTLENPPPRTTIFFLAPEDYAFPPTIHGRAINLCVPHDPKETGQLNLSPSLQEALKSWFNGKIPLYQLLDLIRKDRMATAEVIHYLVTLESSLMRNGPHKANFLEKIQGVEELQTFHNSLLPLLTALLEMHKRESQSF